MARRRFEMHHYRQALLRMRQGDSDRDIPDGHPKLLHSWPPKVLQAGRVNYAGSEAMARRAEASFRR